MKSKRAALLIPSVLVAILTVFSDEPNIDTTSARDGFESIFDGKSLAGWRVFPADAEDAESAWSIENGFIHGEGREDRLDYLVYAGDDELLRDFELKFSYRMMTKGNSGIEVRARIDHSGKRPFEGYHADFGHVGIGDAILGAWDFHFAERKEFPCKRGTSLTILPDGETSKVKRLDDPVELTDIRKRGQWNHCHIIARGNHLQFYINEKLASEFFDQFEGGHLESGMIALQLHDKGMIVQFRDIYLKRLR